MTNNDPTYGAGGRLGQNPVAWIVLLVVIVYALACLVLGTASDLRDVDRTLLIGFVVFFPILLLVMFVRPVTRRASQPAESADAVDEATFLSVMSLLLNAQLERGDHIESALQAEEAAAAVFAARRRMESNPATRRRILWIDGGSETHILEQQAFERIGIHVDSAADVASARDRLQHEEYGAIIVSGVGDGADPSGILATAMPSGGDTATPWFSYVEPDHEDRRQDAVNRGAKDATARPDALFDMVMRSLI